MPGCGKTTNALKLISDDKYYAGKKSLHINSKPIRISYLGLPSDINLLNLIIGLPKDLFNIINFILKLNTNFIEKLSFSLKIFYLIIKSRSLRESRLDFVIDQGIQQFILHCLYKEILSLKDAKYFSDKFKDSPWGANKNIFISLESKTLQSRILNSKKHLAQVGEVDLSIYCQKYELAANLLDFKNKY